MELPPVPEPAPAELAAVALKEARERARILEIEAGDAESDLEVAKEALAAARRRAKEARSAANKAAAAVEEAAKAAED
jgi:hypothetical protein